MVFRVNFLCFWIVANAAFAIVVENYADGSMKAYASPSPFGSTGALGDDNLPRMNDGSIGFLQFFAIYLASLVVYRVTFGGLHILKFKIMSNCIDRYKTKKVDLHEEVKRLRKVTQDWNESLVNSDYKLLDETMAHQDDEQDHEGDDLLASVAEHAEADGQKRSAKARVNRLEQTCSDTDDDDFEFEDARAEEEEDQIVCETSAYMVSRTNRSKYMAEQASRVEGQRAGKAGGKQIIPNKMLDSEILKDS